MSRLFRGDEFEHRRSRGGDFDPVAEGELHGLDPRVSRVIWDVARREVTDSNGACDEDRARVRFETLAKRVAERGGKLGPGLGKRTLVEVEASDDAGSADVLASDVPGRTMRTEGASQAAPSRRGVHRDPGRRTLVPTFAKPEMLTPAELRARFQRYASSGRAALARLERAVVSNDQLEMINGTFALQLALRCSRNGLTEELAGDESLQRELAELELSAAPLLAQVSPQAAGSSRFTTVEAVAGSRAERVTNPPRAGEATNAHAADRSAVPSRVTGLLSRAAEALGLPVAPVHMDQHARQRTEAHNAVAVMAGGAIMLHPEKFDPKSDDALEIVAHELVHVAQLRADAAPGAPRHRLIDAEAEAHALAEQAVAGRAVDRPAIRLTAEAAYGEKRPAAQPTKQAGPTLPKGVPYQLDGTTGGMLVSVDWLREDPDCDISQTEIHAPTKEPVMMRELKKVYWWMPQSAIDQAKRLHIEGPIAPDTKVIYIDQRPRVFGMMGLPPDTEVTWMIDDGKAYEIYNSRFLDEAKGLPDGRLSVHIPAALERRSLEKLEAMAGTSVTWIGLTDQTAAMRKTDRALVIEHDAAFMRAMLHKRWDELVQHPPGKDQDAETSQFGGIAFANSIPIEDREYVARWVEQLLGKVPSGMAAPADAAIIATLRQIDQHPLRGEILERIRASTTAAGGAIDWVGLARLVHDVEQDQARKRLAMQAPAAGGKPTAARYFERPIAGQIINLGSMASVGKELELYFATEDPQGIGLVGVSVTWCASPATKPTEHVLRGQTFHYAHQTPEHWKATFPAVGIYEVTAFVDHQSYWPAHFSTLIEVKTEAARLAEVESHAFADLGGKPAHRTQGHFFDVSWTNDRLGDDKYSLGDTMEGDAPSGLERRSVEQRISFIADDRAKLASLIKKFGGRQDAESKDIVQYAKHAIEALDATRSKIQLDAKDTKPFEIRGSFLSEQNGVRSGDLNLIGLAGLRRQAPGLQGQLMGKAATVRIHDLSKLYEPKDAVYTGQDVSFRRAVEQAFTELCKAYPPGRVSVLLEELTDASFLPSGKTLGFELHTGTAWKAVKAAAWDGRVQLAVNLIAAATSVFVPGAALVAMTLVTAYNATDTGANLVELQRKGQATTLDKVEVGLKIGVDILPFLGKLTQVGHFAGKALFAVDAVQAATNVLVMTGDGVAQVSHLRTQFVAEVARVTDEIDQLRAVNDSDPRIAGKEAEHAALIAKARNAGKEVFADMAQSGAVMMMVPVAFNHLLNGAAAARSAERATHGEPRVPIDPATAGAERETRTVTTGRSLEPPPPGERSASRQGPQGEPAQPVAHPEDGVPPARIVLAGKDEYLRKAALRAQPRPGYLDVVVHADERSFWLVLGHADIPVDHRALATYLKKQGLSGPRLRLIACESGQNRFAVAQHLANKLHIEVLAPSETAWIDPQGVVGVGRRDQHHGEWHTFKPQREPARRRHSNEPHREQVPMRTEDGSEVDPPLLVETPHVDTRARVRADEVGALSAQLGAKVVIDIDLHNGVEVHAMRRKGLLGYDMTDVEVRIGTSALKSDVLAHARTVQGLRRYNGLLGQLRRLIERLFKGRSATSGAVRKPFPPGSRGHITETELSKIEELIEARRAQRHDGLIDDSVLFDEIAFLSGEVRLHTEILQSMADTGYLHDDAVTLGGPDIGAVTREAQALGYKLPGEAGSMGAHADPNHYYYRRSQHDATQFELALKPTAPADAVAYRARVLNGKFQGLEEGAAPALKEVVPVEHSKEQVVSRLRETEGFGPYAEMLEAHGIASRAVIDAAVATTRGRKNAAGKEVTLDWLRHEVKEHFRDRVLKKLLDPALDSAASYRNMREMLDGLSNSDRGALAAVWYRERNAPGARSQVKYQVGRTSGENEGNIETRAADLVVGREAREVKDIEGKIDEEQFGAYVDQMIRPAKQGVHQFDKLRYVFTKPQGAIANLEFMAERMALPELERRLTVEVFDRQGRSHVVGTRADALTLLDTLKVNP